MKKLIIYSYIILVAPLLCKCTEDEYKRQYPLDNIAPESVKNIEIENLPGAVRISYDIPDEEDLLYIQALYDLPNGQTGIAKTSVYRNTMLIKGFGKSEKSTIRLISVDRSGNKSVPVEAEIEPLDATIFDIYDQLKVDAAFGGITIRWENPLKEDIVIGVIKMNEVTGEFEHLDNFYSSVPIAKVAVRGLEATMTTFGISVKDTYGNLSDTLIVSLQPYFEEKIPKDNFKAFDLPTYFTYYNSGASLHTIYDGATNAPPHQYCYISPGNDINPYFTLDLGLTAKFSRFRLWTRQDLLFRLRHPKEYELYGTNDVSAATDQETLGWEDNPAWTKLISCESIRPSGLEPGVPPTTEDEALGAAGEEFEFPLDVQPVRYIRFKLNDTWDGGNGIIIQELSFWGEIK